MRFKTLDRLGSKLGTYTPLKLATMAVLVGLFVGLIGFGGFTTALTMSNTEEFCIGCHEMKDNVYAEYKGTIHDKNRSGVRATCPDCHVPKELFPKLKRKIAATHELYGAFTGKIDTREKFEKHRYEMALNVWRSMKASDSHECRNCHSYKDFSKDLQTAKAQARHTKAVAEGKTCIECHFGIAHTEPDGPGPQEVDLTK
jgi:cytochrome c-type protein NapC